MKTLIRTTTLFLCFSIGLVANVATQSPACSLLDGPCRIKELTQIIGGRGKAGELRLQRGYLFAIQGDYRQAAEDFGEAIASKDLPTDLLLKAHIQRAACFTILGQADAAIGDYTSAILLDPQNARLFFLRGMLFTAGANYDRSIDDLTKAISLDPKNSEAINYRGNVYVWKGDRKKAFADFNRAIELDPTNADAYFNRAYEYNDRKEYLKAISDYDRFIVMNSNRPWTLARAYRNRAFAQDATGNKQQALDDFTAAINLEPNNARYYASRGSFYRKQGRKLEAEADEKRAAELKP